MNRADATVRVDGRLVMLRWQYTPDDVFQVVLHEALESTIDLTEVYLPHHVLTANEEADREEHYLRANELSAKFFSRKEFVKVLGSLLEASDENGTLYQLTTIIGSCSTRA